MQAEMIRVIFGIMTWHYMDDIIVRELQKGDLQNGFLTTLDILKPASGIDPAKAQEIFEKIDADPDHIVIVAESGGRIVGTVTLFIDQKFIHRGGRVGHVEDLAVADEFQSHKVGSRLMTYLLNAAQKKGCYKTILNCPDHIVPFQTKMGFKPGVSNMRFDHA